MEKPNFIFFDVLELDVYLSKFAYEKLVASPLPILASVI